MTGGAVSTTGIAGFTLGGGLGWLMAKHGLAADNLERVELVTAAGEVLDVDADSHPDLFWALRGGGGNFGVATSFTYRAAPGADDRRRVHRASVRGRARAAALLPRRGRWLLRRSERVGRARARTGRLRHEARGPRRLPHRRAGASAERELEPFKSVGLAADGRGRAHAVPGDEHAPRRRLPGRIAQLLAFELHPGAYRRADRHRRRAVRGRPVADDGDPARALPRRRHARRRRPPRRYRIATKAGTS